MMKVKVLKKKKKKDINDNNNNQEKQKLFNKLRAIAIVHESVIINANMEPQDDTFQPSIYIRGKTKSLRSSVSPNITVKELKQIINEEETGSIKNDYRNNVPDMTLHSKGTELNDSKKLKDYGILSHFDTISVAFKVSGGLFY